MTIHKKAADRGNDQAAYERTSNQNNTTTSQWALDRSPTPSPTPMREQYQANCRAADIAHRHLMQLRRLLELASIPVVDDMEDDS
ncbi:MAG: hypothetical protein M3294_08605 [Pseudomonadota bacterium]|nr:hypothetical protein [Pseudomonadota bacterium]